MRESNTIAQSMIYKSLERYSSMTFQLMVQIVIARILSPTDYGVVALMTVFINVASVFVNNGFNMAVIQKKEASQADFSTALLVNLGIGLLLYLLIFFSAPFLASFYNEPVLVKCFRVLGLILPLSSIFSIQSSIAARYMQYRDLFACNISGSILSGIIGVSMALLGFGFWSLIAQQLTRVSTATILLLFKTRWKPQFLFVADSAKEMFSFGWKLLAAGLINQIYNELNSLIIGKKYAHADLAFYTKGKMFPSTISSGVDGALQSVMLSAFSKKQSDKDGLHKLMKKSVVINTYVITPIMLFLAVIAQPFTEIVLTDKWLPMVPFMQICCFTYVLHPIGSVNMQALAAVGRSDIRLKLEFIKKPVGILLLVISMKYGPIAIALSAAATSIIGILIGFVACQVYINYSALELIKDIAPTWIISIATGALIYLFNFSLWHPLVIVACQVCIGMFVYIVGSRLFNITGYQLLHEQLTKLRNEKNSNHK